MIYSRLTSLIACAIISTMIFAPASSAEESSKISAHGRTSVVLKPGDGLAELASRAPSTSSHSDQTSAHSSGRPDANLVAGERELECLARGIYFEARGEPTSGKLAVGQVILNRVASPAYPDTVCDVVYQNDQLRNRCQFSFACDGAPDVIAEMGKWHEIRLLAKRLLDKVDVDVEPALLTSTHYHAQSVNPRWARKLVLTGRVGQHLFYRDRTA